MLALALSLLVQDAAGGPAHAAAGADEQPPRLELVTVLATAASGTEIIAGQAASRTAALTHSQAGMVEIFDLADALHPRPVRQVDLGLVRKQELTSLALPPSGDWFLAVAKASGALERGQAVIH